MLRPPNNILFLLFRSFGFLFCAVSLECEDGEILREAGAEVYYCVGGERAACAMGKNQGWRGVQGGRRVLMALDWFLDKLV
jgi:hypothetical protein